VSVRILHCGKSLENYNICLKEKVAGFTRRVAEKGDQIYIAVRKGKKTICGGRGILSEPILDKPWEDADRYVQAFKMTNVEYCEPIDLSILANTGGKHWSMYYIQGSKEIKDVAAIKLLEENFEANKQREFIFLEYEQHEEESKLSKENEVFSDNETTSEEKLDIMGTFETIKFISETDPVMGLEKLVNTYFFELFPDFLKEYTLLIQEKFKTSGMSDIYSKNVSGIQGIPDALLIKYSKNDSIPLKIILIEYECYGQSKLKSIEKFNYLNGHIIPQLMRFASTFSIVTDRQIRENTVKHWSKKLIEIIYDNSETMEKVSCWIKELEPGIKEQQIALKLSVLLEEAFKSNLGIMLIIDELTHEQRDTFKNILASFKQENGEGISFYGYVVRLGQKISILDDKLEYALSIQKYH